MPTVLFAHADRETRDVYAWLLDPYGRKVVAAQSYRFAAWGRSQVSGVIDLALGVLTWQGWPATGLWVLGLFGASAWSFAGSTGSASA